MRHRDWRTLAAICSLAFCISLGHHLYWERTKIPLRPTIDEKADIERAGMILAGTWPSKPFYQAPLYPFFLAGVEKLYGKNPDTSRYIQFMLCAAVAAMVFVLGRSLHSYPAGLIAGLLIALYKPLIFYSRLHLKTTLAVFLVTACLTLYISGRRRDSAARLIGAALLLGIGCLARGNLLPFIPILGFWLLYQPGSRERRLVLTGSFIIAAAMPIAPVTWFNYHTDSLVLTTWQAGGVFYSGNHRGNVRGGYARPPFVRPGKQETNGAGWRKEAERRTQEPMTARQVSSYWMRNGLAELVSQPTRGIRHIGRKILLFWNHYEMPSNVDLQFMERLDPFLSWPLPSFGWLALLGPAALLALWRVPHARPLFAYTVVSWLLISAFFINGRYRLTLAVPLAVGAGMLLTELYRWIRTRDPWQPSLAAALLLLGAFLAYRPVENLNQGTSWFQLGVAYAHDGELGKAASAFQNAIELNPKDAMSHHRLGDIYLDQGHLKLAEQALVTATKLDRDAPDANNSLGILYYKVGDLPKAQHYLVRAVMLLPSRPETHRNLAVLYRAMGQYEKALFHAKATVELMLFDERGQAIMAYSLANLGRIPEAAKAYWRLRRQFPRNIQGYIGEAYCRRVLKQDAEVQKIEALIRQRFPKQEAADAIAEIRRN